MKFGVQLYGPLNNMQGEALEKLSALAKAGITEIEPCVTTGPILGPEDVIWPADWLLAHVEEIRDMGLRIVSIHVFAENLVQSMDKLNAVAEKTGLKQFVVKTPENSTESILQQTALNYMKAADMLETFGVRLLLHNEAGDIRAKIAGKTAYEHLLDLCMGKVGAQVDVGWVQFGGEDPVAFLERNAARVQSVHHKDFGAGREPIDVPVGTGNVDLAACFRFAQSRDIPQLVDQEHFGSDVPGELQKVCQMLNGFAQNRKDTVSFLNVYDVKTGAVRTVASFDRVIEAPNWLKNSDTILYNAEGHMYAYDLNTNTERLLDTGSCDQCNNDHVVSPDETELAVSHMTFDNGDFTSRVYIVPMKGGEPRLVTPNSPSFLHGWSPDGTEMAYCAFRDIDGRQEVDVYTIPVNGGAEKRLTKGGFNDGPEYSPDGKYIWYNATNSGLMQVWRMERDGGEQTQITENRRNNWFPHVSPDGKRVVYISYGPEQLEPHEHLPNMPVELWLMDADGENQHKILSLFGGQGSINVNSWAGDSMRFAFVSYAILKDPK